jgi:DNA modification methylase
MVDMDQSNGHITTTQYSISDLVFSEYNPRELTKDQHQDLKDSITRFGLVDPLIVNIHKERKNVLVGGHQRLRIAKELGYKRISCVEVELTPEKERELNVRLNKNTGQWDWDALANHFDVGELTEWGFTSDDLQFYVDEPLPGLIDEDEIPEVEEAVTQTGDMWLLGEHRVLCGDATNKGDVEALMGGERADMVFTDPPWNVGYGSAKHPSWKQRTILNDSMTTSDFKEFMNDAFKQMAANSNKGCMTYVVMSAQEWGNMMLTLIENDYHWSSTIIWNKDHLVLSRKDYHTKYEPIWYGWLSGETRIKPLSDRKQSDVWDIKRPIKSELHPTTKPIELVVKAINNSSNINKTVLDLFLGSGSTLIACEKTKRKCYGMEIDPHYCDVIVKRWEEYTGNKAERIEAASA